MPTSHIQHPITDFGAWSSAFAHFAEARRQAGVRAQRVHRPVGDPNYVVVDLDFGTRGEAETFLRFLKAQVWGVPKNAPALAGSPQTMILEPPRGRPRCPASGFRSTNPAGAETGPGGIATHGVAVTD